MMSFFYFLLILYFTYPILSYELFSIQDTLTIRCQYFPLVSTVNNSDLQCARLRIDKSVSTSAFDLQKPTEIYLFAIIHLQSSDVSPVDITINFNPSPNVSSSLINEIHLALLVTQSNFTVNNQTSMKYTSFDIPIFRWQNSIENNFDLIDLLQFRTEIYETDKSLCKWNSNRWDRLFNKNLSNSIPYVYFLKTTSRQLTFTFADLNNISSTSPLPYLNILYCFPYKLGVTEIVIITFCSVSFIAMVIILGVLHYFKGGDDNRTRHFERYYHYHHRREPQDRSIKNNSKDLRRRSAVSVVSVIENNSRPEFQLN